MTMISAGSMANQYPNTNLARQRLLKGWACADKSHTSPRQRLFKGWASVWYHFTFEESTSLGVKKERCQIAGFDEKSGDTLSDSRNTRTIHAGRQ